MNRYTIVDYLIEQKLLLAPNADLTNLCTPGSAMLVYTPGWPWQQISDKYFHVCTIYTRYKLDIYKLDIFIRYLPTWLHANP